MASKKPTPKTTQPKKAPGQGVTPARKKAAPATKAPAKKAPTVEVKRPRGRPTIHTPELAAKVCEHLMRPMSLRKLCALEGMPSLQTVLRWIHADTGGFWLQYVRAREVQAEVYGEDTVDLADTVLPAVKRTVKGKGKNRTVEEVHGDAVERSRLMVDARKWYASKMSRKRFGEHIEVETNEQLVTFRDFTGRKGQAPGTDKA